MRCANKNTKMANFDEQFEFDSLKPVIPKEPRQGSPNSVCA